MCENRYDFSYHISGSAPHSPTPPTPPPPLRRLFVTNSSEKRMVVVHGDLTNKYFLNINVNVNVDREEMLKRSKILLSSKHKVHTKLKDTAEYRYF